jgi:hypothetical protein
MAVLADYVGRAGADSNDRISGAVFFIYSYSGMENVT